MKKISEINPEENSNKDEDENKLSNLGRHLGQEKQSP